MTRVRDSLRFTLADGTYKKTHAGLGEQVASSYIAGLTARPYWDARGGDFPWMEHLERNHETIRDELRAALADPLLQQKGNAIWVAAARDDAEGYGPDWRTLVLQDRCEWEPTNVTLFPETVALVRAPSRTPSPSSAHSPTPLYRGASTSPRSASRSERATTMETRRVNHSTRVRRPTRAYMRCHTHKS